jgi:hypothetical protein
MKLAGVFLCSLTVTYLTCGAAHAALSADDFLPPVQAEGAQRDELLAVKNEASVKTEVDSVLDAEVTTAPTLQDAINKVIEKPRSGCQIIAEPGGGYAFVATGQSVYNPHLQNVNASRIDQRNAYVKAFMNAKAEMAKTVGEIVVRGANNFDERIDSLDTQTASVTNIESELTESQMQSVRKVLKGYVTYSVRDDDGSVCVTIVSSSKTRGQFGRTGTDGVTAASLRDGLNSIIAEIKNGFVPPVGGRIITVPGTGEIAFVGFGSSVVRHNAEKAMQERLKLQAERMAGTRALDALAGILTGDDTEWQTKLDQSTNEQMKEYEEQAASDQTTRGSDEEIRAHEEMKKSTRTVIRDDTRIQSIRQGVLPPGVMRETILDDNEYFAYGIAVYVPSLSDAARSAGREMDDARLIQPPSAGTSASGSASKKEEPKLEMKQGPSGVVKQDL